METPNMNKAGQWKDYQLILYIIFCDLIPTLILLVIFAFVIPITFIGSNISELMCEILGENG